MKRTAFAIVFAFLLIASTALVAQETAPAQEQPAQASAEPAKPAAEFATVVFYRPKRFMGSGLTPSVYLDGEEIARLDNGRYVKFKVKAGKHALASSMKSHAGLELEFKAGETYYVEMAIQTGNWRGGGRLIPAPAAEAKEAVEKLKPLDAKWIKVKTGNVELAQNESASVSQ